MGPTYSIEVFQAKSPPRGHIILCIRGPDLSPSGVRIRFMRWGHKKPYLGDEGWQVAEAWISLTAVVIPDVPGDLQVTLPPSITSYLEEGSNYIFSLERAGSRLLERPIRWAIAHKVGMQPSVVEAPRKPTPVVTPMTAAVSSPPEESDETVWLKAAQLGTREAYQAFLGKFPKSGFAPQAQQALAALVRQTQFDQATREDELAWAEASTANTRKSYTKYLLGHPEGRYKTAATSALNAILPDHVLIRTKWFSHGQAIPYGVDTCVFMLTEHQRVRSDRDFISGFATDGATGADLSISSCQSVKHLGTAMVTGKASGVETITTELPLVAGDIKYIAVSLSIDNRVPAKIGLESIDAELEIVDATQSRVLQTFALKEGQFGIQARVMAVLQRTGATWSLEACEDVFEDGIAGVCRHFGVTIQ